MSSTIQKIKRQLCKEDDISVLDILYEEYMNTDPVDQARIGRCYRQMESYIRELPFESRDQISCSMIALCAEQERIAFLDGVRTGARLVLELTER